MSEGKLLNAVLEGTQVPHQPLMVITDTPAFPGLPLFREIIRRSEQAGQQNVVVSVLHSPEVLIGRSSSSQSIDLTSSVPGFDEESDVAAIERRILEQYAECGDRGSIFIDALDVLAEDHSPSAALRLFRSLLTKVKDAKPPSRLVLLLPAHSTFLTTITPPTITPTITILHPHPPQLLTYLSKAYLAHIEASGKYLQILDTALRRRLADDLAVKGDQGLEVGPGQGLIVQVTVRKAVGGTKGMSRSLEALVQSKTGRGWEVKPVSEIVDVEPISQSTGAVPNTASGPPKTHADLDLPFNLTLTDQQKAARMGVPLPYAHEGEGAAVDLEFDDEEDEDDEEI